MKPLPQSLVEEMQGLLDSDGWKHIVEDLDERIENLTRNVHTGKLDHDDYVRKCESIRELKYVQDLPAALLAAAHVRGGVASVHS